MWRLHLHCLKEDSVHPAFFSNPRPTASNCRLIEPPLFATMRTWDHGAKANCMDSVTLAKVPQKHTKFSSAHGLRTTTDKKSESENQWLIELTQEKNFCFVHPCQQKDARFESSLFNMCKFLQDNHGKTLQHKIVTTPPQKSMKPIEARQGRERFKFPTPLFFLLH